MNSRRRTPSSSRLIRSLLCTILALYNIQHSLSSSSSSTRSIISTTKNQPQDKIFKPNKRTIVSGFGAHSTKHSIFTSAKSSSSVTESKTTSKKKSSKKQQSKISTSESTDETEESIIIPNLDGFSGKSLLVYKSDMDQDSPDSAIWLMDPQTPNQKVCIWVNGDGDWMAELVENDDSGSNSLPSPPLLPTSSLELNGWTPIEGLYGFYKVPTGILLVLIAKTRNVFEAPIFASHEHWWRMDKVQHLEVVHLFNSKAQQELSPIQIKEEIRQLRLLRKAWKQHDFYCCQYDDGSVENDKEDDEDSRASTMPIVRDMTKSLQSSFLAHQQATSKRRSCKTSSWWMANPDPRFFWNQVAVEPILAKCALEEEGMDLEENPSLMDPCTRFLLDHTIPVTSAFVGIQSNIECGGGSNKNDEDDNASSCQYTQLLISRRSRFRAGTRFTRRGADANGAVANYVETEQVLLLLGQDKIDKIASHVQTRGSIPIRWSSPADVKTYRPKVHIGTDPLAQARALRWHLLEQQAHYVLQDKKSKKKGQDDNAYEMVFVNLVDKKSDQGRLGKAFDEVLQAVLDVYKNSTDTTGKEAGARRPLVKHVWYDFHAEVKNGKWDRLSILLKDIEPHLKAHNYFVVTSSSSSDDDDGDTKKKNNKKKNAAAATNGYQIESKQTSMVRTNCMDCLDRTNVVQSIVGRFILLEQLLQGMPQKVKKWRKQFQKSKQLTLPWPTCEKSHRALWADNADEISRLYAGTPALKRDFTRTGQRTKLGALDDGMNSLQRYYLNNFLDADRQEGMDLMVGYASFSNVVVNDNGAITMSSSISSRSDNDDEEDKEEGDGSIFATRRSFLGGLFQPQPSQSTDEEDAEEEDDDVEDAKDALDLRWVPGDLQEHLRSRAEEEKDASTTDNEEQTKRSLLPKLKFDFDSTRALKAMDERSTSDLPWWSLMMEEEEEENADDATVTTAASTTFTKDDDDGTLDNDSHWLSKLGPHQRHPTLTPGSVLSVLLLGFRAPMQMAMGMVLFLGLLFVKDIFMSDFNMAMEMVQKSLEAASNVSVKEEDDEDDDDDDSDSDD